jgi:AraC-like DNA-binding protein
MAFLSVAPDPRLSPLVLSYWQLDGMAPGQTYIALPKRHLELVVNVGAPQLSARSRDETPRAYSACWLTVFRERPLFLDPTGPCLLFGVRFRDFALPDWLSAFRRSGSQSADLSDSALTAPLIRSLARCSGIEDAATQFDAFFLAHSRGRQDPSRLSRAVELCEGGDRLRPSHIIREAGREPRRVRALAEQAGGVSIRRFARLARLDRALVHLAAGTSDRIADVAQAAGYYDEAHMAHDFVALCGITPARYRRARPDAGLLPHHLYPA